MSSIAIGHPDWIEKGLPVSFIKEQRKNNCDIDQLAMVKDTAWQHGMVIFCKPFTKAQVHYFDRANTAGA
jgi:hypothetical protein